MTGVGCFDNICKQMLSKHPTPVILTSPLSSVFPYA